MAAGNHPHSHDAGRPAAMRRRARRRTACAAVLLAAALLPDREVLAEAPGRPVLAEALSLRDDAGREVYLSAPAKRVVTLAPHATELAYVAGAGDRLVATVNASDHPAPARALPRIGQGLALDPERIAALAPDLVIGWQAGRLDPAGSALARLGVPLYVSAPARLADLPQSIRQFGLLMGTRVQAEAAAASLQARLQALARARASRRPLLRVYVQAGADPFYTLNGEHIVSDALALCGADNVFAALPAAAPRIGRESVLAADPDAIVVTRAEEALDWRAQGLPAAVQGRALVLDPDTLFRPGPRLVDAAERLCAGLDAIRASRTPAAAR